jgi:hypothetical protein
VKVVVYVEGGGNHRKTLDDCRRGFGRLFENAAQADNSRPKVIACGGRSSAFHDFRRDLAAGKEGFLILLVDSEGPVPANVTGWEHLGARMGDAWQRPAGTTDDQVQLMVQCMESWFMADKETLSKYYGEGFLVNSLPGRANIEEIPKQDVEKALDHASRLSRTKGPYHKTGHGFDLLALLDPNKLRRASICARTLFELLEARARM